MLIQDINPPHEDKITVNFALAINELEIIEEALKTYYKRELDSDKAATILGIKNGVNYARKALQTIVDEVIREHGEA